MKNANFHNWRTENHHTTVRTSLAGWKYPDNDGRGVDYEADTYIDVSGAGNQSDAPTAV